MDEDNVFIGDTYQIGSCIVQVSCPRDPCYKINKRFAINDVVNTLIFINKCGWFYRIIKDGKIGRAHV